MSIVVIFLTIATMVQIGQRIWKGGETGGWELGILSWGLAWTMEDNRVGQIIIISTIIVLIIGQMDTETVILKQIGGIGLIVLGTAQELIIVYLGIELVSLTFYVLAGRERKGMRSTEAGLKYFILGALSSGILLMGITIVYAQTGITSISGLEMEGGGLLIVIGLLFKLGAAPLHMWVIDVYEGSATIITTYFAVVPKIAYMTILMEMKEGKIMIIAGLLSILVGSIGAINQTKLKRMLAYSAIGHVGFMILGIGIATKASIQATIVYMIIYIIMTVNSFTVIMSQGVQKVAELRGISRRNGVIGMTMGLGLLSIAGVPPLAGFYSKYLVVLSVVEQGQIEVALIGIILSVISAFYYVRVIRYMYFKDTAEVTVVTPRIGRGVAIVLGWTTYLILTIMLNPGLIMELTLALN